MLTVESQIAPAIHFAARSDAGAAQENNEDSVVIDAAHGLAILADGIGGSNAGEVASSLAASVVHVLLEEGLKQFNWRALNVESRLRQLMCKAIHRAHRQIRRVSDHAPQLQGMGTTLVMGLFARDHLIAAHVGDSRLYRYRDGKLHLLTRDHSYQHESSQTVRPWHPHLLTRALGVGEVLEIETRSYTTLPRDLYLLCSDGLSDMLGIQDIEHVLHRVGDAPQMACDMLIATANALGGTDNCSVILARVDEPSARYASRLKAWVRRLK